MCLKKLFFRRGYIVHYIASSDLEAAEWKIEINFSWMQHTMLLILTYILSHVIFHLSCHECDSLCRGAAITISNLVSSWSCLSSFMWIPLHSLSISNPMHSCIQSLWSYLIHCHTTFNFSSIVQDLLCICCAYLLHPVLCVSALPIIIQTDHPFGSMSSHSCDLLRHCVMAHLLTSWFLRTVASPIVFNGIINCIHFSIFSCPTLLSCCDPFIVIKTSHRG